MSSYALISSFDCGEMKYCRCWANSGVRWYTVVEILSTTWAGMTAASMATALGHTRRRACGHSGQWDTAAAATLVRLNSQPWSGSPRASRRPGERVSSAAGHGEVSVGRHPSALRLAVASRPKLEPNVAGSGEVLGGDFVREIGVLFLDGVDDLVVLCARLLKAARL